jgi:hypothetical protein
VRVRDESNPQAATSAKRRDRNKAAGLCINETQDANHGLATHGVRCLRCHLVKRLGSVVARDTEEWKSFKPVLPAPDVVIEKRPPAKRGPKPRPIVSTGRSPFKKAAPLPPARRLINTCALCTNVCATRPTDLNGDGVMFEVCARCNGEHPRSGGYGFDDGAANNPAGVDRASGHRRRSLGVG